MHLKGGESRGERQPTGWHVSPWCEQSHNRLLCAEKIRDRCKKKTNLCAFRAHSALTPILQLHCSSPTLLIVSFHARHTLLLLLFLFASLSVKTLVSLLLSDDECWSSGEEEGEEERMYPRGLFGVQLSVGQHAPRRAGRPAAPRYNWRP